MAVAAQSDAVAMSMPAQFIRQNRRACPTAASRAIAREGAHRGIGDGAEADGRHGREKPVEKNVRSDHSRLFLTISKVADKPDGDADDQQQGVDQAG